MDKHTLDTILAILPTIPLVIRTTILHFLRRTPASHYLDLRTELTITILRALISPSKPQTVTSLQAFSTHDPGIKGRIWIAHYACPAPPEPKLRDALMAVVARLGEPHATLRTPALVAVEAEWTGYRADVAPKAPLPALSERERYHEMSKECSRPTTILYFHGGAFYLCDPATHRATTKKLAKLTGGRCYSVRYRLAPQEPFPAALLDALVSYFALLYPPPDAYHDAVKPEHIVFAGDSAGGNLALALLKLLQELRRDNSHILWHGTPREIPLPAGVATNSPWVDMVQSAPAWELANETPFDYLPKLETSRSIPIPVCAAWPVDPPRKNMYIEDSLSFHPLATLIMAQDWKGSPPIYICTGWEILAYEDKFLAQKLHTEGVPVRFEEYEAMAHCFALMFPKLPEGRRGFEGWGDFINQVVEDPNSITSSAVTIKAKTLREVPRRFEDLCDESEDEVRRRVLETASRRDVSPKL